MYDKCKFKYEQFNLQINTPNAAIVEINCNGILIIYNTL